MTTHITNFADDYHLGWTGESEEEIQNAISEAAEILEVLESHGFLLKPAKSALLIKKLRVRENMLSIRPLWPNVRMVHS